MDDDTASRAFGLTGCTTSPTIARNERFCPQRLFRKRECQTAIRPRACRSHRTDRNCGSATDAAHIAAEFVGRYKRERAPLPAIALATDMGAITSITNDYGYDELFARQVRAHGQKGDIAIAISTSGNSPNVLKGVAAARECGLVTIGWTGGTGGKLAALVDYPFVVPSTVTARIQESHITLGHVLCELSEEQLLGKTS
jgi:D-sedoheptulose 7-phosphate isomerase